MTLMDRYVGITMDFRVFMEGIGQRNLEGRMLLEFCLVTQLCVTYLVYEKEKEEANNPTGRK